MEKVNRLGWADGISFTTYGLRIGVRTNTPAALEQLAGVLPPGWQPSRSPEVDRVYSLLVGGPVEKAQQAQQAQQSNVRRYNLLYADAGRLARSMDLDGVLARLEGDLRIYIAERARQRLFVHAGVVAWRGRAILIPGTSHSGKTSLVAALLRAGATYYSDEYVVLDARGRVHPFSVPLSLRDGPHGEVQKRQAEALGGSPGVAPLPVGLVVITKYQPGARWQARPLSQGQAMLALLGHTVPVRRRPRGALATLRKVVASAAVVKGVRGEAEQMCDALLSISPFVLSLSKGERGARGSTSSPREETSP